jgi:hypothetical protein
VTRRLGVGRRQDQCELVAADAVGAIAVAQALACQGAHAHEDGIAGRVPAVVVDHLEVVEVQQDQRERIAVAA